MLVGIDEVGRGCIAGPLCVAAVSLSSPIPNLRDSKNLTPKRRAILDKEIRNKADYINIILIDNKKIDKYGLSWALKEAFNLSIKGLAKNTKIILDGNVNYIDKNYINAINEIKADDKYPCVSAASIVAKVYRDKLMLQLDIFYPEYGFSKHKGYGTKSHYDAIKKYGLSELHRKSFNLSNNP